MLKYCLIENSLAKEGKNYVALVTSPETKTLEDLIDVIIAEGTGLTRPQALAYFEKITQTVLGFLKDGHRVVTPLFAVRPTIKGTFNDADDSFDKARHSINVRLLAGKRLRGLSAEFLLVKSDISTYQPLLKKFIDAATVSVNSKATPNAIGTITGNYLQCDVLDLEQGVFFVPVNKPDTQIRAMIYSRVFPKELSFNVPALDAGEYRVLVKTKPKADLLSSLLNGTITVL